VLITGIPPIASPDAQVLVLGSIPGRKSLEEERYYVGPRNRFWPIMARLLDFDPGLLYDERVNALRNAGIALWDVLRSCERKGSLDSNIVKGTEVLNDFSGFMDEHPALRAVAFNGQTAFKAFRHADGLPLLQTRKLEALPLPSTSAVNTRASEDELLEHWRVVHQHLG
jgi:TDG/mug DNA glycosylase family protein